MKPLVIVLIIGLILVLLCVLVVCVAGVFLFTRAGKVEVQERMEEEMERKRTAQEEIGTEKIPDSEPPPKESKVKVPGASQPPVIIAVKEIQSFFYENNAPVGVGRPTHKASTGKKLVEVEARLFFPKAGEWDLAGIQIETQDSKRWQLAAINYAYIYCMAQEGALVMVKDDGGIVPVRGLPVPTGKVTFLGTWEGGEAKLSLAFEIPEDASPKRLIHGDTSAEISKKQGE